MLQRNIFCIFYQQISVSVPNLGDLKTSTSGPITFSTEDGDENIVLPNVKVIRSVSDVIALNIGKIDSGSTKDYLSLESSSNNSTTPKIYMSSDGGERQRRNSAEIQSSAAHKTRQNRLLLLKKRHSGFHLRRPEILETVYSVSTKCDVLLGDANINTVQ